MAAASLGAGIAAGIAGIRSLSRSLLVVAGTVAAGGVLWLLMIHPDHPNDIAWQISAEHLLSVAVTVVGAAVITSRLLRKDRGEQADLYLQDMT